MRRSLVTELEVVLAVAQRLNFRAAAKELGISATLVSNTISELESRIKVRLFNRSTRNVALTSVGERYVERIAPAVAEIRRASEEISAIGDTPTGILRINVSQDCMPLLHFPLINEYLTRYPQMRLDITSELRMGDVAERFDAGIRMAESVPRDMVVIRLTGDMKMLIVATPDYFTHHGKPQTPDDLVHHHSIGMRTSREGIYSWELERHQQKISVNVPPRIVLNEISAIHHAALSGVGLAFIPDGYVREDIAAGRLVSVLEDWCMPFGGLCLYHSSKQYLSPGLKAFIDLAKSSNNVPKD